MRDKNLLQRSPVAWLALGISLAAGFVACSDDDTGPGVTPDGSVAHDSGNTGGSKADAAADVTSKDTGTSDTSSDVVVADVSQGDSAPDAIAPDAGSGGAPGSGGSSNAGGSSHAGGAGGSNEAGVGGGGGVDAGPDVVQPDANTGDSSSDAQADVTTEADAHIPMPPLALCAFLDSAFSLSTPTGCETQTSGNCDDRANAWIDSFWFGWADNDCRIKGTLSGLTDSQFATWHEDVNNWTYFFFGCPQDPVQWPLSSQFGLVPKARWDWPYTAADLQAFGETFIAHARIALTDWGVDFSTEDLAKIEARMAYLVNAYEHARSSSQGYSASICTADGGSDASPE